MKKLISLTMVLVMLLSLVACSGSSAGESQAPNSAAHEITDGSFPFYIDTINTGDEVKLYFLDGANDLPYVELNDWAMLINKLKENLGYQISLETDGAVACFTREDGNTMVIDFDENTFSFVDYNLYMKSSNMSTILDSAAANCVNEAGQPALLKRSEEYSYERYGDEKVIRLGDYDIDLIAQDGLYLVPLQTMCDFTLETSFGDNMFFNGQALIVAEYITKDHEIYYAAPTGERSEALAKYGYNELCLMLDNLYGLKEIHEIESFDKLFEDIGFKEGLQDTNPETADKCFAFAINKYLDDLHSGFRSYSYLTGPIDFKADKGPCSTAFNAYLAMMKAARSEQYPDSALGYEEVGNTAYPRRDRRDFKSSKSHHARN